MNPRITTPLDDEPLAIYRLLANATPAEKADLVLDYITRHGRLDLPERDGLRADLRGVDLSREALEVRLAQMPGGEVLWWFPAGFPSGAVNLEEANLQGADLRQANLLGANLHWANLPEARLWETNLRGAFLDGADLPGAELPDAKLQGATLRSANLQRAHLRGANLQGAVLEGGNLQGADLAWANLQGADLRSTRLEGVDFKFCTGLTHIRVAGAYLDRTRLRREQLGENIGEEREARESKASAINRAEFYTQAKHSYLALKQNFEDLGDYDAASWAYRKEREMERLEAGWRAVDAWWPTPRPWQSVADKPQRRKAVKYTIKWLTDTVQWILTDYGESVWRVLGAIGLVFLGFAALYGVINGVRLVDSGALTHDPKDLALFSLGAMTTLLPPNLQPACDGAQVLVNLETLLAVALTGLLGFVLGNRIRHS
jgi:uncharacterized protein YjbI with pentapeptide repeats